ncbi:MAG TPA: hypothetical protein VG713_20185 [Pirellulales bacterium]|jgi:hypothetical protein|nr:hypothetical protein [Pirellulales bacterium]
MVEFYLGLVVVPVVFYFLWGVYDPAGQQDVEYRWMHSIASSVGGKTYARPRHVRLRNILGLTMSLVVLALAVFGGEQTGPQTARSKAEPKPKERGEQQDIDELLRHQSDRGDAYYRTNSPFGRPGS